MAFFVEPPRQADHFFISQPVEHSVASNQNEVLETIGKLEVSDIRQGNHDFGIASVLLYFRMSVTEGSWYLWKF